jgi:hypothetical protein
MKKRSDTAAETEDMKEWSRFERAVDAAVKSGPKHRAAKESKKPDLVERARQLAQETAALSDSLASLPPLRPHAED